MESNKNDVKVDIKETVEHIHSGKHTVQNDNPDSIEIGTPSKGGALKVYGNFSDVEGFKDKIRNAKTVREFAKTELEMG